jgi:hypothetical protein
MATPLTASGNALTVTNSNGDGAVVGHANTNDNDINAIDSIEPPTHHLVLSSMPSHGITVKTVFQGDTRRFVLDDVKEKLFENLYKTVQVCVDDNQLLYHCFTVQVTNSFGLNI